MNRLRLFISAFQLFSVSAFASHPAVTPDAAIERLYDLNPGTTPVEEGSPHERPHNPLLLLAVFVSSFQLVRPRIYLVRGRGRGVGFANCRH